MCGGNFLSQHGAFLRYASANLARYFSGEADEAYQLLALCLLEGKSRSHAVRYAWRELVRYKGQRQLSDTVVDDSGDPTVLFAMQDDLQVILTKAESRVVTLLSEGYTQREIAEAMGLYHRDVNSHCQSVARKVKEYLDEA